VAVGHTVAVASQFCFDAAVLTGWLARTRAAVDVAVARAAQGAVAVPPVVYHIGVPGPTKPSKLKRIAEICEVPSLFLNSAFDVLDLDGDGLVLCCVARRCAVLCCAVLCCAVLCCAVLCCAFCRRHCASPFLCVAMGGWRS
jgi:hypothetical protein